MAEQTLKEKAAKGLFWGGVSNGVQQLLSFLIGVILLKKLTPADYGMIGMLSIFTAIANTIQESGFTAALTNRQEFKDDDYNSVFWFNIVVGTFFYIVLFFCAPLIAIFYDQSDFVLLSRILFLSIIASSFGIAHNAVLFKQMMVKERAKIDIVSTVFAGIIAIVMALSGFSYWSLVVQILIYAFGGTLLRWYFSPWRPSFSFTVNPIKEMFGFGSKMLFSSIVTQFSGNLFSVLLGKFYTVSDVGYFTQGNKWAGMGTQFVNGMVVSVTQPIFAQLGTNKDRILYSFRKMLRFIAFVSFPIMFGFAFIANEFIAIINSEWLPSVPILQLYCIWGAFSPICVLYMQCAVSQNRSTAYLILTIFYAVIQVFATVFSFSFGMYWIAFSLIISSFIILAFWHYYLSTIIPIRFLHVLIDISPYFLIMTVIIFVTSLIISNIDSIYCRLGLKVLLCSSLYILTLFLTKSVIFNEALSYIRNKIIF